MDFVFKTDNFHSAQSSVRSEFSLPEVEIFYKDYLNFLEIMPITEKNKYISFTKNGELRMSYINIYKERDLFNFQFIGAPDICWSGPKVDYYKTLVDTSLYNYSSISNLFFRNTVNYLEQHPEYTKATLMIYKPGALVMPHTHSEGERKVLLTHTLLNDMTSGEFHFWCEFNHLQINKRGSTFDFEGKFSHFAASTDHAVFIEIDKLI